MSETFVSEGGPLPDAPGMAPEHTGTMTSPSCQYTDIALTLQQAIRDREAVIDGADASLVIGGSCGNPSIGSVSASADGDARRHFCGEHVLQERIQR